MWKPAPIPKGTDNVPTTTQSSEFVWLVSIAVSFKRHIEAKLLGSKTMSGDVLVMMEAGLQNAPHLVWKVEGPDESQSISKQEKKTPREQ